MTRFALVEVSRKKTNLLPAKLCLLQCGEAANRKYFTLRLAKTTCILDTNTAKKYTTTTNRVVVIGVFNCDIRFLTLDQVFYLFNNSVFQGTTASQRNQRHSWQKNCPSTVSLGQFTENPVEKSNSSHCIFTVPSSLVKFMSTPGCSSNTSVMPMCPFKNEIARGEICEEAKEIHFIK